jgi:transcription initiation factor TFIIB
MSDQIMALNMDDMWNVFDEMTSKNQDDEYEKLSQCKNCKSNEFKVIDGISHCIACGLGNSQTIDNTSEWRFYGADDNKSSDPNRCGMLVDPRLPQTSMQTMIGHGKSTDQISKLHRWYCSAPYREKSLRNNFESIKQFCEKLNLNECVQNDANSVYFVYTSRVTTRGRNHRGTFGACIFIACRRNEVNINSKDICDVVNITNSTLMEACKKIQIVMNDTPFTENLEPNSAQNYISIFATKIKLSKNVLKVVEQVLDIIESLSIIRQHTAPSIATGTLFFVIELLGLTMTKTELSQQCNISEVTISKTSNKIKLYKHLIIPHINLD